MAYEYNLSPIDIDGAIKAVQDNAFRAEQLRLKYEESISKSVDDQYKMYGGKVRKQDQAEFDGLFSQYAEAQKRYQSLNRFGGNRAELTKAAGDAQMYKNNMMAYIKESTSWGATQTGMAKIYKDGSKLLNRKKYDDAWMNMSSMTTNELKEVYTKEGKNTFPTDFDFKVEDFDNEQVGKLATTVKKNLPISAPNSLKDIEVIDPATGKQKLVDKEIVYGKFKKIVQVPVVSVKAGLEPRVVLNSVMSVTATDQDARGYLLALKKSVFDNAANAQDPQIQKDAEAQLQKAMEIFGIKDKNQVNEYHIYSSNFIDQNRMGEVEIEDWRKLDEYISIFEKDNKFKLNALQMQKLKKDISTSNSGMSLSVLGKLMNVFKTARDTGLTSVPDWQDTIGKLFNGYGLTMDPETIKKAAEATAAQSRSFTDSFFGWPLGGNGPRSNQ